MSDVLYTWDGKHLYKGRFAQMSDVVYTFDGKHLYRGRYSQMSDVLLTVDGIVPVMVLLMCTI